MEEHEVLHKDQISIKADHFPKSLSLLHDSKFIGNLNQESLNTNQAQTCLLEYQWSSQGKDLRNLQELGLSVNKITELIVSKEFLKLNKLENLDLSWSRFSNNILSSLNGLSSLKTLDISYNNLKGPFHFKELDGLSNLHELKLSGNEISEFIISKDLRGLSNLSTFYLNNMTSKDEISNLLRPLEEFPKIKTVSLCFNNFQGQIFGEGSIFESLEHLYLNDSIVDNNFLQSIGTMRTLKTLSLEGCGLSGNILTSQGLCQLKHLQALDLSDNDLNGNIPWCLANFTSLQYLDLSENQFNGTMFSSPLQSLTSLKYLSLYGNLFQIPISLTPLFNLSQLKSLIVGKNLIYADINDYNLIPKFQLELLNFNGYYVGYGDVGAIPKFLYHQHNLQWVVISNIKLRGNFPHWLLENNTRMNALYLNNNSLSGSLQLPTNPHVNLSFLDISDNSFIGYIPSKIGVYFPRLESLDMSRNEFKGNIPDSLCNTSVYDLDMSRNNISGRIPKCMGNMFELRILDLSNNNISGCLPFNFSSLIQVVKLSKNRLQGSLNHAFYYCFSLIVLDLSHNNLSGSIPSWIERDSQLSYIVLGHNNCQGEIPIELCKMKQLSLLDISHNRISGHMIPCLNFTSYWDLKQRFISIPLEFTVKGFTYSYDRKILGYMSGILLSVNNLIGRIPLQIGDLRNIKVLNFSHNSLSGTIPPTFSNLKEIESLDLSHNNLQGTIPHQLTQLTSIAVFNVSYNNLFGRTPNNVAQFATFDESSYKGNPFLRGWPLLKSCNPPKTTSSDNEESNNSFIDMKSFYVTFGVAYGMMLLVIVAVLCINPYWRRVWFYYVQMTIDNSYYFIIDNIPFLSRFKFPKFCRRIYKYVRD
ncbi:cuscuta receptor 1-like isoform X2 [Euphorbia lathyris]|uniref:cuscuta receptor 1-like isoform X2 n=1 Tax=Euphorbia lathyris TaxID=212925 RepID=UPI003313BA06